MIPILGYVSELLPPGSITRHEKIVSLPFQFPMTSKLSSIEQLASKEKTIYVIHLTYYSHFRGYNLYQIYHKITPFLEDDHSNARKDTLLETYHGVRINIK